MTSSCSFRITRTAEDLAQAISALSQRLIKLEQRQEALELQLKQSEEDPSLEEIEKLDGVDQLLKECQSLLESSDLSKESNKSWPEEEDFENSLAA